MRVIVASQSVYHKQLFEIGDIPQITTKLKVRWLTLAGHYKRAKGCIIVSKLVTWQPTQGSRSKGCPKKTYVDLLEDDTGYAVNKVENSMQDRCLWQAIINARQQELTEWMSEAPWTEWMSEAPWTFIGMNTVYKNLNFYQDIYLWSQGMSSSVDSKLKV